MSPLYTFPGLVQTCYRADAVCIATWRRRMHGRGAHTPDQWRPSSWADESASTFRELD
jgi:hypothetical protein